MDELKGYGTVLVDLDGTLYRNKPLRLVMALELLLFGWRVLPVLRAFRREHENVRALAELATGNPFDEQLERAASKLGMPRARVAQVVADWMVERPLKWLKLFARVELLEALAAHQRQGAKVALVSDYPATRKATAFARWLQFDAIVCSGEPNGPKRLKPDPEGYLLAAAALDSAPEQCLVIGDRDDADGGAARAAGMAFSLVS